MSKMSNAFKKYFYFNEVNNMVGSGGEFLIKGEANKNSPSTLIEVGDLFVGIGVTHMVESLSRNPGPDAFRVASYPAKTAARAFRIVEKKQVNTGFDFVVDALSPKEYSDLLKKVSQGAVDIPADTIPQGTMILSFLNEKSSYTLDTKKGSPRINWVATTSGERHWNVGLGKPDDFWMAQLPSDDYAALSTIEPWTRLGQIRFGLSYLEGSQGKIKMAPSPAVGPKGKITMHDFSFSGTVVGKRGLATPFPIVMRTEITCRPVR